MGEESGEVGAAGRVGGAAVIGACGVGVGGGGGDGVLDFSRWRKENCQCGAGGWSRRSLVEPKDCRGLTVIGRHCTIVFLKDVGLWMSTSKVVGCIYAELVRRWRNFAQASCGARHPQAPGHFGGARREGAARNFRPLLHTEWVSKRRVR